MACSALTLASLFPGSPPWVRPSAKQGQGEVPGDGWMAGAGQREADCSFLRLSFYTEIVDEAMLWVIEMGYLSPITQGPMLILIFVVFFFIHTTQYFFKFCLFCLKVRVVSSMVASC